LLLSYKLYSNVNFPVRIYNISITAIDSIFIDKVKYENYSIHPLVNGLSGHDAQIITINNITLDKHINQAQSIRKFNKFSISQFAVNLSYKNRDNVFKEGDVNTISNNFLNTYLRSFNFSFPLQKIYRIHNNKPWITTGIKTSCQHKRELYLISRDSNNSKLKAHYKSYCLILSKVIKVAKQLYYNNKISKSNNKIKTTWDIIKIEKCKNHTNKDTQLMNIYGNLISDQQLIADSFNNYYLTVFIHSFIVADKITSNIKNDTTSLNCNNPIHCLHINFKLPCLNIKLKYTSYI